MSQKVTLKGVLAGLALIALVGVAPALAQSSPAPEPGLEPIGATAPSVSAGLDPLPRYAVISRDRLDVPSDLPPVDVEPIDAGGPEGFGAPGAGDTGVERPTLGMGANFGSSRRFGGSASAARLPERYVNVRRVRAELADVRAELGL